MATKIVTKNSSTASAVPTASDLVQGELAVNVADKRLFTEDNGGSIVELGTNPYNFTANHNGSAKLATTATGIDVTGTATMDGLTVDGATLLNNGINSTHLTLTGTTNRGLTISTTNTGGQNDSGAIYDAQDTEGGGIGSHEFRVGGESKLLIAADGDISFYEDTGTTPKFFWDASAESLGIGTSSIAAGTKLQVAGETRIYPDSGTGVLRFGSGGAEKGKLSVDTSSNMMFETGGAERMRISGAEVYVGHTGATAPWAMTGSAFGISLMGSGGFIGAARSGAEPLLLNRTSSDGAIINLRKDGTTVGSIGVEGSDLTIGTGDTGLQFRDASDAIRPFNISTNAARDAGIDLGRSSERFRDLYLSGRLKAGAGTAAGLSTINAYTTTVSTNLYSALRVVENTGASSYWDIGAINGVNTKLNFYHNANTAAKMSLDSDGGLALSGGVYLGGTGAANKLDDYEEGTFTATLTSVTPPTVPPTATCYYTKVGNLVNAFIRFTNVNTTGGAGTMTITGLPFTAGGPAANNASCPMTYGLSSPGTYVSAYVNAGTSVVSFLANNDNANWLTVSITAGSAKYLTLNVTYHTA